MSEPFVTIDLHGLRTDEDERVIENALKKADAGTYQIRLIHGFNRGTAIRDMIYDNFRYE